MNVKEARYVYWLGAFRLGLIARDGGLPDDQFSLWVEAKSIALDTATARAISGGDTPGSGPTWSQRWRTVQQTRWQDALHRTLLKSVAY